ncbi:MAG: hypothetical protein IT162_19785 [Bryobacterales bacterium]|nr:hypothetical protein [Bryobacterales bacterium]
MQVGIFGDEGGILGGLGTEALHGGGVEGGELAGVFRGQKRRARGEPMGKRVLR